MISKIFVVAVLSFSCCILCFAGSSDKAAAVLTSEALKAFEARSPYFNFIGIRSIGPGDKCYDGYSYSEFSIELNYSGDTSDAQKTCYLEARYVEKVYPRCDHGQNKNSLSQIGDVVLRPDNEIVCSPH